MTRELRDVLRLLTELEQALRHEETRVLQLGHEIKDLTSRLERQEADKRESEKTAMTSGHALRQLDGEMARVRERCNICERELVRLASERASQEEIIRERQTGINAAEGARTELEQAATLAQQQLAMMRENRNLTAQTASERKAHVATLEERHRSAASVLQRLEVLAGEMHARIAALQAQMESAFAEACSRS